MIHMFLQAFGFALGILAAGVMSLILWGLYDLLSELLALGRRLEFKVKRPRVSRRV